MTIVEQTSVEYLRDVIPYRDVFDTDRAYKLLDSVVVEKYDCTTPTHLWKRWPGKHKNVHNWYILSNGLAVGWNESPTVGWSFPVIRYRKN